MISINVRCTTYKYGIASGEPNNKIYASVNIFIEWLLVLLFVQIEHRNAGTRKMIHATRRIYGCTHLCIWHNIV